MCATKLSMNSFDRLAFALLVAGVAAAVAASAAQASYIQPPLAGANNNIPDGTHPAVGLVGGRRMPPDMATPLRFHCSGSLIESNIKPAKSWVLTAGHCVESVLPAAPPAPPNTFRDLRNNEGRFQFGGPTGGVQPSDRVRYHTDYNFPGMDVGLMRLGGPRSGIAPLPIRRTALAMGDPFTAIGFGNTGYNVATGQNFGFQTKRQGDYSVANVFADGEFGANNFDFANGAAPLRHLCQGDSGGPSLFAGRIGGVHSFVQNPGAGGGFSPCDGNNTNNGDANVTVPFMYNWIDSYTQKAIFWDELRINAGAAQDDFEPSAMGYDFGENGFREGWGLVNVPHPMLGQIDSNPGDWRYFNAIGIDNDHATNELYLDGFSSQGEILINDRPSVITKTFTINIPVDPNFAQLCQNLYQMQNCGSINVDVNRRWNSRQLGEDVGVGIAGGPIQWAGLLYSNVAGGIDAWEFRQVNQVVPAGMQDVNVYLANVPEPGTLGMVLVGAAVLLGRRGQRRYGLRLT